MTDKREARLRRERETFLAMIGLYCRGSHGTDGGLCSSCREILEYSTSRLDRCPFGAGKPACRNCPVHCYATGKRDEIRRIMRFSGPRMMLAHPVLAVLHLLDGLRKPSRDRLK